MKKNRLKIIYEDKYLIVVEKPAGLLTISTSKEQENTLYHQVHEYLRSKNTKIFIVHRLDKDTSGIVLLAKSEKVKNILQDNWENVKREYVALVNGVVKKDKDTIKSYLKETKTLLVYSTNDSKNGKLAITEYEKIKTNNNYSLLKINIKTGRKNQIRVQLNDIGHSIVGDRKYGKIKNKNVKRLCLHASCLEFVHPITNKIIKLESECPSLFFELLNN